MSKGHNDIGDEGKRKVIKFLQGLGPYASDGWSNSYYSEILEHIEQEERRDRTEPRHTRSNAVVADHSHRLRVPHCSGRGGSGCCLHTGSR